ncbi:GGDEF domain-containing protein [Mycobacterium sp. Aquia_216]|nr:GGDEF domain-containing protein [Mycobacterium sp. Aquia_216]
MGVSLPSRFGDRAIRRHRLRLHPQAGSGFRESAACTDPLTRLLNRAGWEIATADLLARSRSAAVTVTVLDIDNFKTINDTQGHLAGDEYLVSRADCWRNLVPANAVLARIGGDEFAVCIADDTNQTHNSEQFVADVRLHTPHTSIGTASQRGASADIRSLYAAADAELYDAKHKVRQRVDPLSPS